MDVGIDASALTILLFFLSGRQAPVVSVPMRVLSRNPVEESTWKNPVEGIHQGCP